MPQQVQTNVENNFTKGLITEATGLNFPENAATFASNCEFTLIGDIVRREGINTELNGSLNIGTHVNPLAQSTYVWNNPGGDGNSKLLVRQIGGTLYFYNIATSTVANPLSTQLLPGINGQIQLSAFLPIGSSSVDTTLECQYADGNGYLFIYHPSCDPAYVLYNPVTLVVTASVITVQVRDYIGVLEPNVGVTVRPNVLTTEHTYNLANQGWTSGNNWYTTSTNTLVPGTGAFSITVGTGLTISNGDIMTMSATDILYQNPSLIPAILSITVTMTGTVTSYTSGSGAISLNITNVSYTSNAWAFPSYGGTGGTLYSTGVYYAINYPWTINSVNKGLISTWHTAEGNYPSNSDIWWTFKDDTDTFNPGTTQPSIGISNSNAPQGHYLLNAFNMDRNAAAALSGITVVSTTARPTTGAWFQGRVWYTGVNSSFAAVGDVGFFTWTENIYYSQIVQTPSDFGACYSQNDGTSEFLNAALPTDGGYITIVGSGTIHKLFPIQNGMIVFANNGVWFITGSQGIGFAATDYTVTKISAVKCLSNTSYIDVLGLPYFWNEEGIYQVMANQNGQLGVEPLTVGTILSFYNEIPLASKKYARGSYDPINYTIQWCYRSSLESGVINRYQFDSILNFNTYNKAFFPYSISVGTSPQYINGINYISYPYISNSTPDPDFKYISFALNVGLGIEYGIAEEYDTTLVDWGSANYTSQFTTGYKLHGQGMKRFQVPYIYVFSRNTGYAAYYIQSAWDYGINFDSNHWSQPQFIELNDSNSSMIIRRHRLRGTGRVMQLMFTSVPGQPFDLMGWALYETMDTSV
jgi:hypothetical protein